MAAIFPNPFRLSTLNGTNGFVLNGVRGPSEFSGWSVSNANDINSDKIKDIVIGANMASFGNFTTYQGASYVIFGHGGQWNASFEIATLDGTNGFVIPGINSHDYSGSAVASIGDITGDGIDDLIIGAWNASPGGLMRAGQAYVIFGHSMPWKSSLNPSNLDGNNGFLINGIDMNGCLANSVSSAGDINGDGIGDFVIGAPCLNSGRGAAYIFFGHSVPWEPILTPAYLDGKNGFLVKGLNSNDFTGNSVTTVGDVNGDGTQDLIIGAPFANTNSGISYVIFGHSRPWNASFDLASLDGKNGFMVIGANYTDYSGWSCAGAGDVNGDKIDDIIIGAHQASPKGKQYAGAGYVVFGHRNPWPTTIKLSNLDGKNGFICNGIDAKDNAGYSVSSAGDINNDGIADLLIGSPMASSEDLTNSGKSYIVFGHPMPWKSQLELSDLDGLNGFAVYGAILSEQMGKSVAPASDINHDGVDDLILGAPYGGDGRGRSYVILGRRSQDSLKISTNNQYSSVLANNPYQKYDAMAIKDGEEYSNSYDHEKPQISASTRNEPWFPLGFKMPSLSINDYLITMQYALHYLQKYSPFTWPWNRLRTLAENEFILLQNQLKAVAECESARKNQRTSHIEHSAIYRDKSLYIEDVLVKLPIEIKQIIDTNKASTRQLSEITQRLERMQSLIHELSKSNKVLKKIDTKLKRIERRRPKEQMLIKMECNLHKGILNANYNLIEGSKAYDALRESAKNNLFQINTSDFCFLDKSTVNLNESYCNPTMRSSRANGLYFSKETSQQKSSQNLNTQHDVSQTRICKK